MKFFEELSQSDLLKIAGNVPENTRRDIMNASGDQLRATLYYYLMDLEEGSLDAFQNHPEKELKIQNSGDEEFYKTDGGVLSHLTDQEMRFLLLNGDMRKRFSYKAGIKDFVLESGKKYYPLQARSAKEQVNADLVSDIKAELATGYMVKVQKLNQTNLHARSAETEPKKSLIGMADTLKACEANLNDQTHWYNSSKEYRAMQKNMEALRQYTENLSEKPENTWSKEERDHLLNLTATASASVNTYLLKKNPESFKNHYEEKRYWAARAAFKTLKEFSRPLVTKSAKEQEVFPEQLSEDHFATQGDYAGYERQRNNLINEYRNTANDKSLRGYHFLLKKSIEAHDNLAKLGLKRKLSAEDKEAFTRSFKTLLLTEEVRQAHLGKDTIESRGNSFEKALKAAKDQRENTFERILNAPNLNLGQEWPENGPKGGTAHLKPSKELAKALAFENAAPQIYKRSCAFLRQAETKKNLREEHIELAKELRTKYPRTKTNQEIGIPVK